ncbi:MAG: hypothetical protein JXA73_12930 [Acidobacteria bacterium]|nr:hypothetical protein [Acidobacteriota bacterium]
MLINILITIAVIVLGYLALLGPAWKEEHGWGWYSVLLLCGAGAVLLSLLIHLPVFLSWIVALAVFLVGLYYLLTTILAIADKEYWESVPFGIPALSFLATAGYLGAHRGIFSSLKSFLSTHGHYLLWLLLWLLLCVITFVLWIIRKDIWDSIRSGIAAFRRNRRFAKDHVKLISGEGSMEYSIEKLYKHKFIEVQVRGLDSSPGGEISHYPPFYGQVTIRNLVRQPIQVVIPIGTVFRSARKTYPHMITLTEKRAEVPYRESFCLEVPVAYLRGKGLLPDGGFELADIETASQKLCLFIKTISVLKNLEAVIKNLNDYGDFWDKERDPNNYALWLDAITCLQAGVWAIALGFDGIKIRKGLHTLLVHRETLNFRENVEGFHMELGMDISDAQLEEIHKVIQGELTR